MTNKIGRRSFLKKGASLGAISIMGSSSILNIASGQQPVLQAAEKVDLAVVKGRDYFQSTIKAVKQLGGMEQFVPRQSRVGLLANVPYKNYGAHVRPEVVLAAVKMIYDAGAKEIRFMKEQSDGYWERTTLSKEYAEQIKNLKPAWDDYVDYDIADGISLKDASINKELLECDVFINVSISKHNSATDFTCILKNMMGACATSTNLTFHLPFGNVKKLSQRIADLNLIRKPDLCIADCTEFLITKGPWGPGKIGSAKRVVAGTNRVALDTYCCRFHKRDPKEIHMIQYAQNHGMGSMDLSKINIEEINLSSV